MLSRAQTAPFGLFKIIPLPGPEAWKSPSPSISVTEPLPRRILLLALTTALKPMAVALVKFSAETLARNPTAVLLLPVVLRASARFPLVVLPLPVFLKSASVPLAVLNWPVVLLKRAKAPLAVSMPVPAHGLLQERQPDCNPVPKTSD